MPGRRAICSAGTPNGLRDQQVVGEIEVLRGELQLADGLNVPSAHYFER
jgi:hypothetical protein